MKNWVRDTAATSTDPSAHDRSEAGFTMIEVVVSMFLLALIAITFLPLLIQAMRTTVTNATIATASQLASQQIERIRAMPANCDQITAADDVAFGTSTDSRGSVYQPHLQVGACPASYPGLVEVRAWVTQDAATLAEAHTLVYVSSQSAPAP